MTALSQFEKTLESLLGTKPPGVSGSKVQELTKLAVQNIKENAQFVTQLYKHFRLSPGTHKLGVLYVVDSIARQFQEQARRQGQDITSTTDDRTFAGGLRHLTSVLPSLMNDILQHAPDSQKDKIKKLLDIWQRSKTFPDDIILEFRQKMEIESTTPTGTPPPPPPPAPAIDPAPASPNPPDAASVLSALAAMAKAAPPAPPATNTTVGGGGSFTNQSPAKSNADPRFRNVKSPPQQVAIPAAPAQAPQPPAVNPLSALASLLPQSNAQTAAPPALDTQKLAIIQLLVQQGVPIEQIAAILNGQANTQPPAQIAPPQQQSYPLSPRGRNDRRQRSPSRSRSPPGYRGRSRSRSISPPKGRGRGRGRRDSFNSPPPPRRRRSPSYDDYRGGGGRRSPSRSRSPPPPRRRSPPQRSRSPLRSQQEFKPRYIEWDDSLKPDRIRVLSRTLFVGGVTQRITEDKLRGYFSQFGGVQSIIMNLEKRCAFLKMYTRDGAVSAREGMEAFPVEDTTIRTKYGVGFGPRDCSDYATGISIIPISRLTDADKKWVVTAEYGGTGGRPLEPGMILEEPDIEIGAGVSSKAISQKVLFRGKTGKGRGGTDSGSGGRQDTGGRYDNTGGGRYENAGGRYGDGAVQGMQGMPPFPMVPGMGVQGQGMFPPFLMPPQMQAFFQQQFGGQQQGAPGQGQGMGQGQQGFEGGYGGQQQGEWQGYGEPQRDDRQQ